MTSPLFYLHDAGVGQTPDLVVQVLLIEDHPPDAEMVIEMLADEVGRDATRITHVERLDFALQLLSKQDFQVALVDLSLPDTFGLEIVARLQLAAPSMPIVVLSGGSDIANAVRAVQAGAQDYLVKGQLDGNQLVRALRYAIERKSISDQLQGLLESLEQRVEQRTAQLRETNEQMRHEITERLRVEEALRTSEGKYRELTELASDAIFIMDRDGHFIETNQRASELLGYNHVEMLKLSLGDVLDTADDRRYPRDDGRPTMDDGRWTTDDRTAIRNPQSAIRNPYQVALVERVMRRKNGTTFRAESSSKAMPDGRIQAIVRDVTERTKLEEERHARLAAELAYESKNEFLARVSHELRTPLNAILGFGQLLEMDELTPEQEESVVIIMQAGRHLLELVDKVLEITGLERGIITLNEEVIPIQEFVLANIARMASIFVERGVSIHAELASTGTRAVLADRERLNSVLTNVLTNAVEYNHKGGSVVVSGTQADGIDNLRINITDTGRGIAADKIGLIFTPFERLGGKTGNAKGTGLGLVLARLLMQEMHGDIGVESELGRGTTFWIELPVAHETGMGQL